MTSRIEPLLEFIEQEKSRRAARDEADAKARGANPASAANSASVASSAGAANSLRVASRRGARSGAERRSLFRQWHVEATAFLYEIVRTADTLKEDDDFGGEPALYFGPKWALPRAIERCGGAPTFADLGRLLQISRQAARELALKTETSSK